MTNPTRPDHRAGLDPERPALDPQVTVLRLPVVSLSVQAAIATCGRTTRTTAIEAA